MAFSDRRRNMRGMKRNVGGVVVLIAICAIAWAGLAGAGEYPNKRLTYNICFNPGGESDLLARIQEQPLKKAFGQDVAINYKIGGGGALCWAELVQTKPDGYTIAGFNLPHIALQPIEMSDPGYKTLDLKPIYIFQSTPSVLLVQAGSPYKTLKDFADYVKAKPGVVTVGGSGTSSGNDVGTAVFANAADLKVTYVPFSGTGTVVPALLGGHVTAMMDGPATAIRYSGKFRALAIASPQRLPILKDVPTFREFGYDVAEGSYRGVAAPPGTPDEIIKYLAAAFDKAMKDPEVQKKMDQNGFTTEYMGPEASAAWVQAKIVTFEAIMKKLGRVKK
jgi:tripartite-type tricarboxylate transporter receptor subunit TctC